MRILIGLAAALTISTSALGQETVRIGTEGAYAPFNYTDADGQLKGFDIDIANALCEEMEVTCEFVTQDWDRHHPGAAGQQVRRHHRLHVDHRRAQAAKSTSPNKYYNTPPALAVSGRQPEFTEASLDRARRADRRRPGLDHAFSIYRRGEAGRRRGPPLRDARRVSGRPRGRAHRRGYRRRGGADRVRRRAAGGKVKLLGTLTPDPVINGEGAGIALRKGEDELAREVQRRHRRRSARTAPTRRSRRSISTSTSTAARRPSRRLPRVGPSPSDRHHRA